ncbi:hypothetical protein IAT38_005128 [Cryptococcus sp. DSM 104549]
MPHRRQSSTSTYEPDWQHHQTEKGGNMAKQRTSYPVTHEEMVRRASASTSNGAPPKKGFFAKLFSCSCLEFDETQDPVAKYRKKHEALYGPSPPEPLPPFAPPFQAPHSPPHPTHPYSTNTTPGFADASSSSMSVDTTGEPPSQSHRLFIPATVADRVLDQQPPGGYSKPNGSFAGGTTGGSGAGGAGGCGGGGS